VSGRIARRLVRSLAAIVGSAGVVFVILRIAPGDPVTLMLGQSATPEAVAALRAQIGLDEPLPLQFLRFLGGLVSGDFGASLTYQRPTIGVVLDAFPNTVLLGTAGFVLAILIAVPVGILSATRRGSWLDKLTEVGVLLGQAVPAFWTAIMLVFALSLGLHLLPTSGSGTWQHLVMPAITVALVQLALLTRIVRAGLLEVLREDYIRTARGKGLPNRAVLWRHAFRNALLPVVTMMALQAGSVLAGSVVTEAVFAWPGIGALAISAIMARDYPLVQTIVLFSSVLIVTANFLADTAYAVLDPRVRV